MFILGLSDLEAKIGNNFITNKDFLNNIFIISICNLYNLSLVLLQVDPSVAQNC